MSGSSAAVPGMVDGTAIDGTKPVNGAPNGTAEEPDASFMAVLRNRSFLLLWLSQAATQIGGNMVLYGLTVVVLETTESKTAVSGLMLTFLVPAVLFSAVAGVFVDRFDAKPVLWVTNLLRALAIGAMVFAKDQLLVIYLLNIFVSTVTTFFSPAEAAMIPRIVPRNQLVAANGIFTITLNAAFALGFALFGSLAVTIVGPTGLILIVAGLYFMAAVFCFTLPSQAAEAHESVPRSQTVSEAEKAVSSTFGQLREGLSYIRQNPTIAWSIVYLGSTASLIGVLGVLGPSFAQVALGLDPRNLAVIVLPLGFGVVLGILALNNFGQLVPRRRIIEGGLILLGILIAILSSIGLIPGLVARVDDRTSLELSNLITVLSVAIAVAFLAGVCYAGVAISSQTQLQEDLPEDVRGRVFGVLFTLISVASFVPVIIVGPVADIVGTPSVLLGVAILLTGVGVLSVVMRGTTEAPHVGPPAPAEPFPLTPNSPHSPSTPPAGRSASHAEELRSTAVPDAPRGD